MSRRNDSASIFTVGCLLTNVKMKRDAKSMMPNDSTTTVTMTTRFSVMPTAVMTESSENTMSSSRICASTEPKVTGAFGARAVLLFGPLELVVDLGDRLVDEEQATRDEDEVLPPRSPCRTRRRRLPSA